MSNFLNFFFTFEKVAEVRDKLLALRKLLSNPKLIRILWLETLVKDHRLVKEFTNDLEDELSKVLMNDTPYLIKDQGKYFTLTEIK
ncbi:MAG: hypothetical protein K8H86_15740 [Ignavibacteriaceae bacterium]|nr:hypothetical protein [Ignavibacteriaceae bacterium]